MADSPREPATFISFNTTVGVSVTPGSTNNAILGNSITANGGIGIDLIANELLPTIPTDTDEGANDVQNFPVLTAATGGVTGSLNSIPNGTFRIEFFGNTACDASGNGEGATFLGATSVTTDGTGNATIPLFPALRVSSWWRRRLTRRTTRPNFPPACCRKVPARGPRISNVSGNWENAANWSGGIVPGNGDTSSSIGPASASSSRCKPPSSRSPA